MNAREMPTDDAAIESECGQELIADLPWTLMSGYIRALSGVRRSWSKGSGRQSEAAIARLDMQGEQ
jgi:hypothetical protein